MVLKTLPAPTVIVEWENVRLTGRVRVTSVLRELHGQMLALAGRFDAQPELIVTYRAEHIREPELLRILHGAASPPTWPCDLRPLAADSSTSYYDQKNLGASAAKNGTLVFLDSDVLPQAGWLEAMLEPFCRWQVSVLAGATSVETASLYGRAMALAWILPAPPDRVGVRPAQAYFANNLAFRRALFLRFPFPESGAYRGQCAAQLQQLQLAGIPVLEQTEALTLHPPPPGLYGFAERAWYAGTGAYQHRQADDRHAFKSALSAFRADLLVLRARIRTRTPVLHSSRVDRVAAWLVGTAYFLIKAAGTLYAAARHPAQRTVASRRSAPSVTGPV